MIKSTIVRDKETYPAYSRKIAAVDSQNSIGIERKKYQQKMILVQKHF